MTNNEIFTNNLFECEGSFPECEFSNWDFYIQDPDNRVEIECENEDLLAWVEKVEDNGLTKKFCLACAVRERLLTEEEIQAFDPVAWKHYQALPKFSLDERVLLLPPRMQEAFQANQHHKLERENEMTMDEYYKRYNEIMDQMSEDMNPPVKPDVRVRCEVCTGDFPPHFITRRECKKLFGHDNPGALCPRCFDDFEKLGQTDIDPKFLKDAEPELQTFMCTVFRKATLVCEVPIRARSEDELDGELAKFKTTNLAAIEIWQESDGDEIDNFWILEDHIASEEE